MTAPSSASPPPKRPVASFWYGLVYAWNRAFKKTDRRAEFEHKYAKHGDYFGYTQKPYERLKYERTLAAIRAHRRGNARALELGCSIGVFTKLLAAEFDTVVATDISDEALRIAATTVGDTGSVTYARSEVETLNLGRTFDLVLAAEVLLYIKEADAPRVVDMLDRHLAANGVIIEVNKATRPTNDKFFFGWDTIIAQRFPIVHRETHDDPDWPYEIVVYARPA